MENAFLELWYRQMTSLAKDATQWQKFTQLFSEGKPSSLEDMQRWYKTVSALVENPEAKNMQEEWFKAMGVVPRERYLALLERHEEVIRQLEAAEAQIKTLKALVAKDALGVEGEKVFNTWQSAFEKTLEVQSSWLNMVLNKQDASAPKPSDTSPE